MTQNTPTNGKIKLGDPITMMFADRVKRDKVGEYESWLKGIHNDAKTFDGFLDVNFVKPNDQYSSEYITIIKFDSQKNINDWMNSITHAKWLAKLPGLIDHSAEMQQASGLELWFSRPRNLVSADPPPFWKQVVLSVSIVYPLIVILNFVLSPVTSKLPWLLSLFISVTILSSLLAYPIMPAATKLLSNWLYPDCAGP